jgi:hypothetical protein
MTTGRAEDTENQRIQSFSKTQLIPGYFYIIVLNVYWKIFMVGFAKVDVTA